MNELVAVRENGHRKIEDRDVDALRDQISHLATSIEALTVKIENLINLHREVVKWLLVVVCAIALGKGLLEIVQQVVGKGVG